MHFKKSTVTSVNDMLRYDTETLYWCLLYLHTNFLMRLMCGARFARQIVLFSFSIWHMWPVLRKSTVLPGINNCNMGKNRQWLYFWQNSKAYTLLGFFPMNHPWNSKFSMKKPMKGIHGSLHFHEKCMKYFMLWRSHEFAMKRIPWNLHENSDPMKTSWIYHEK